MTGRSQYVFERVKGVSFCNGDESVKIDAIVGQQDDETFEVQVNSSKGTLSTAKNKMRLILDNEIFAPKFDSAMIGEVYHPFVFYGEDFQKAATYFKSLPGTEMNEDGEDDEEKHFSVFTRCLFRNEQQFEDMTGCYFDVAAHLFFSDLNDDELEEYDMPLAESGVKKWDGKEEFYLDLRETV